MVVKTYPVLDHFCIDFLPSPSFLTSIYSMGTDTTTTKTNLGKAASATPAIPRRPSPASPTVSSNKLQRTGRSQSPSQFNNPSKPAPPPTTRVPTPNPNSAISSVPNQQGNTATSTTKPHNTTARDRKSVV